MHQFLIRNIKDVIKQHPTVGEILSQHKIGCTTCEVGTCQLQDIIEIHNLSAEEEQAIFGQIAQVVSPDTPLPVTVYAASRRTRHHQTADLTYSPPLKKLVKEHMLIKRWLALVPALCEELSAASLEDGRNIADLENSVKDGLAFIRQYADKFHHAKEEDILFKYFDSDAPIIQAMNKEHTIARGYVKTIDSALAQKDYAQVVETFKLYQALLQEHIKKEDELLYPWMDRQLTTKQVGELYNQFTSLDTSSAEMAKREEEFVKQMEARYRKE
jgi:hemerythrin-like domain-containing protein